MKDPTEKKLKAILYRHFCPSQMELGEFKLGLLDAGQLEEIVSHVENCPYCQKDLVQISDAITLPLSPVEQTATPLNETPSPLERIKVFIADLLSPPPNTLGSPSLQLALRGQDEEMKTQTFQIGPYLVALSFERDPSQLHKHSLIGDISSTVEAESEIDFQSWKAYLWQENRLLATVPLEEDGHFTFEKLQTGHEPYELILSSPTVEIHLQHLQKP